MKDISIVKLLHGSSMLAGMPILVSALSSIQLISVLRKHLAFGQFSCSLFFIDQPTVVNLPERTETGLISGSDKSARVLHSCNTG